LATATRIDRELLETPLPELLQESRRLTLQGFGRLVSYSRKVFIPLTMLCRDSCHYCTFARAPRHLASAYLSSDEVLAIAQAGATAGCKEALFTLGDKPELRYAAARAGLAALGATSTIDYLERSARAVLEATGLLPHLNPGVLSREDLQRLRPHAASMGLMLETAAERLSARGGPHFGSPDKLPAARLACLRAAGEQSIAMTTGLLIGIGETRAERLQSLHALHALQLEFGHIQELIIQNFKAKPGTKMQHAPEPALEEQLWTIAAARLIFGAGMSIQAPPNLQPGALTTLVDAGINDWGGVSPVTPDHVNPEAPWPHLAALAASTAAAGRELVERLALTPAFAQQPARWTAPAMATRIRRLTDSRGLSRTDGWHAGTSAALPAGSRNWLLRAAGSQRYAASTVTPVHTALAALRAGREPNEPMIVELFNAEGDELRAVLAAADETRRATVGDTVTFVVNRNINYTNICKYHCGFCAFSKGRGAATLRGPAYLLDGEEIARRTVEAAAAGATEVCLQGGIHPEFDGNTYLSIVRAVKAAIPSMHVHAFSPLEVTHGATTLGLPLDRYLGLLADAGLGTLPGTAAEILDDEIRDIICPDKLKTDAWLNVLATAHRVGLRTTATIMYGHVEGPVHWARHLLRLRRLQATTGGITEFVPLPYVHMEAPLWRRGVTRSGPTLREAVLMHAVGRLVLHPLITNIQASWVKMGPQGAALCLDAGCNDLGGTLINESITRAAGGENGQCLDAAELTALAASIGRPAQQRTTLYAPLCVRRDASPQPGALHAATGI
jgi:FO synthase